MTNPKDDDLRLMTGPTPIWTRDQGLTMPNTKNPLKEGDLVLITGPLPKNIDDSNRIGTFLYRNKTDVFVLLPDGIIYSGPLHSVIPEQKQA